jgi:signal transduction histidine kinase
MTSLRARLIAWHLCAGALTVLCVGLLAATALIEVGSYTVRQSMAAAAREAPVLVEQYRAEHHTLNGVEPFLRQHFATSGLIVRVNEFGAIPGVLRTGGPPPGLMIRAGGPRREPPSLVRLLAMEIKPITAGFHGGEVVFFVDPVSLQGLFRHLGTFLIVLTVLVMLGAWRLAIVVAEKTLQPLVRTTDALNRFGAGDFTPESVSTQDRTELGELARAYNRAVDQITRAFHERDRAAAEMRQFVADAGHQLRTPLTVIMAYVSGMANRPQSLRDATTFATLLQQSRRMKALIDELIMLARLEHPDAPAAQYVDLNDLCGSLPSQFDEDAYRRITVSTSDTPAAVHANETDLSFAFCALIDNALKYAPESDVEVTVQVRERYAIVTVADRGPGMTAADMRNAFDRFYRGTASEGTEGTGLGLAIVRKSIERAGGTIVLESRATGGLTCIIRLPVQASSKRNDVRSNDEQRTYVYE